MDNPVDYSSCVLITPSLISRSGRALVLSHKFYKSMSVPSLLESNTHRGPRTH